MSGRGFSGHRFVDVIAGTAIFLVAAIAFIGLCVQLDRLVGLAVSATAGGLSELALGPGSQAALIFSLFVIAPIALVLICHFFVEPRATSVRALQAIRMGLGGALMVFPVASRDARGLLSPSVTQEYRVLMDLFYRFALYAAFVWVAYRVIRWVVLDERMARSTTPSGSRPPL